jgi:predicted phosphodiesterase
MRTLLISDLHLGSRFDGDLLRREHFRELLRPELEAADQVILLGDAIELRDRPLGNVLEIARPFLAWLAELAEGRRVVLVPGNHDHHLVAPWLDARRMNGAQPLGLEQFAKPDLGLAAEIARLAPGVKLELAYPGIWVGPRVYATHGHYLDCHITVPTYERLSIAVVERLSGALPEGLRSVDDYESVQAPLYGLLYSVAQSGRRTQRALGENSSARVWEAVHGRDGRRPGIRGRLLGSVVLPGAVTLLNRLGLGPLHWDISIEEIKAAGVRAMRELVARLAIDADHVIFGHTHRRGPLDGEPGWEASNGARLLNTGSWVYARALLRPTSRGSVFWPGTVAVVDDDGPPRLLHLLDELSRAELDEAARAP